MKNMVVEMIARGTFKVVDLTSLILLVRDILNQCLLYYQESKNRLAQFWNYKGNNCKWQRLPKLEHFWTLPLLDQDDFNMWLVDFQKLYDQVMDPQAFQRMIE